MKTVLLTLLVMGISASLAIAQTSPTAPSAGQAAQATSGQPTANAVPPGTVIPAELAKSLDAKKTKVGSEFVAKTTQDLLAHGQIIIPRGSKIIGHVTQAEARSKQQSESTLGIAFDRIEKKNGSPMSLAAAVQAIAPPQRNAAPAGNEPMSENPGGMAGPGNSPMGTGGAGMGRPGNMPGGAPSGMPESPGAQSGSASGGPSSGGVGALSPQSQGVIGMRGLTLNSSQANSKYGTLISSATGNVHLDSGTQLILRAVPQQSESR